VNESALRQLLHALPAPNVAFLKRLLPFLRQVAAHASKNQLVAESLATFFGTTSVARTQRTHVYDVSIA